MLRHSSLHRSAPTSTNSEAFISLQTIQIILPDPLLLPSCWSCTHLPLIGSEEPTTRYDSLDKGTNQTCMSVHLSAKIGETRQVISPKFSTCHQLNPGLCKTHGSLSKTYYNPVQVFIRFHILGFVGFIVFSYIHYWQRWRFQSASKLNQFLSVTHESSCQTICSLLLLDTSLVESPQKGTY